MTAVLTPPVGTGLPFRSRKGVGVFSIPGKVDRGGGAFVFLFFQSTTHTTHHSIHIVGDIDTVNVIKIIGFINIMGLTCERY